MISSATYICPDGQKSQTLHYSQTRIDSYTVQQIYKIRFGPVSSNLYKYGVLQSPYRSFLSRSNMTDNTTIFIKGYENHAL